MNRFEPDISIIATSSESKECRIGANTAETGHVLRSVFCSLNQLTLLSDNAVKFCIGQCQPSLARRNLASNFSLSRMRIFAFNNSSPRPLCTMNGLHSFLLLRSTVRNQIGVSIKRHMWPERVPRSGNSKVQRNAPWSELTSGTDRSNPNSVSAES